MSTSLGPPASQRVPRRTSLSPNGRKPTRPSASPSPARSRLIKPQSQPITLLRSDESRTVRHVEPLLLLAYFYARFPALVKDPVSAMTLDLVVVGAMQTGWAMVCLPPCPTPKRLMTGARKATGRGGTGASASGVPSWATRINTALLSIALTLVSTLPMVVFLILFGAPLTTHIYHTSLLAVHMTMLGILPIFYTRGVDKRVWWEFSGAMLPGDSVWGGCMGTLIGAWLGAVPIPLDWDREWQKWPVTILTGAYLGCIAGRAIGEYVFRGKRIELK